MVQRTNTNNTAKAPLKLGAEGEPVIGSDIQTGEDWWDVVVDSTAFIAANDPPRPVDQFEIITKTAGESFGHVLAWIAGKAHQALFLLLGVVELNIERTSINIERTSICSFRLKKKRCAVNSHRVAFGYGYWLL